VAIAVVLSSDINNERGRERKSQRDFNSGTAHDGVSAVPLVKPSAEAEEVANSTAPGHEAWAFSMNWVKGCEKKSKMM
jgi:hypothetical protein